MDNIKKLNIIKYKIVFFGYGAVAKCVWNYFDYYFEYDYQNIYIIDQYKETLYGPKLSNIPEKNIIIKNINNFNFDNLIKEINIQQGDIIIDLTYYSNTYYFISRCLSLGINYINSSIEDSNDNLMGSSIEIQQQTIKKIWNDYKKNNEPISNILTEFGQNPGLIQHYILYALNKLNNIYNKNEITDYSIPTLKKAIINFKIGTILSSEIDYMNKKNNNKVTKNVIENTWSVLGFIGESIDEVELVYGEKNKFIKPFVNKKEINFYKSNLVKTCGYKVIFFKESALNYKLNSICPILNNKKEVIFENYKGTLIHHGEIFEFAKLFGEMCPFMSYVYKMNKHAEESLKKYINNYCGTDINFDLQLLLLNEYNSYNVFDNILETDDNKIIGHDSIGCTIFCGEKEIEKIYWCGSILSDDDENVNKLFTPTIIQVAAGVLTGLSYIMEDNNKNKGLINPCDLNTDYVLSKSLPLLGKFFFTEIPNNLFNKNFKVTKIKYI